MEHARGRTTCNIHMEVPHYISHIIEKIPSFSMASYIVKKVSK
jgi:hypothetical protein